MVVRRKILLVQKYSYSVIQYFIVTMAGFSIEQDRRERNEKLAFSQIVLRYCINLFLEVKVGG